MTNLASSWSKKRSQTFVASGTWANHQNLKKKISILVFLRENKMCFCDSYPGLSAVHCLLRLRFELFLQSLDLCLLDFLQQKSWEPKATPLNTMPPWNKALIRSNEGTMVVDYPLIRPHEPWRGDGIGEGTLDSHDKMDMLKSPTANEEIPRLFCLLSKVQVSCSSATCTNLLCHQPPLHFQWSSSQNIPPSWHTYHLNG